MAVRLGRAGRLVLSSAIASLVLAPSVHAQAEPNPAAEQGAPGAPDPTAPHQGTATPAATADKRQPPAVDLSVLYTAEFWGNTRGGIRRGTRYLDNLDVTLTIDAERARGWRGATLFVYGLYNNGHAFSGNLVGDAQVVSNIETGVRAARLYQAWIEQAFAGGRASLKLGLYDLNSEFDTTNVGSLSLLSSHGIGPEFAGSGRNGPSIFPYTSLGLRGAYTLGAVTLRAAVLDGVPDDPAHPRRTAIKLGHGDGALAVGEVDWTSDAGAVKLGAWHYTARFQRRSAADTDMRGRGNAGAYLVAERRLTHRGGAASDDKRGLSGFLQAGIAAPDYNRVSRFAGGGLVYTGVFAGADRAGVTFARAAFSGSYRALEAAQAIRVPAAESVVELTYRRALTPWLTVQPDAQYIVHPSGGPERRDALAVGLRVEVGK
jgi:porin